MLFRLGPTARRFQLALIKPSHYDDEGYVIQWMRSIIPSNTLAVLYSLFQDSAARQALGSDVAIDISVVDEITTRVQPNQIVKADEMLVVLDGLEDPHNLGAVIRTAHAAGADAIVVPERRAAGLTDTVAKAAAGALEHLPVARVSNINRTLEELKKSGFWIYGMDERGDQDYDQVDYAERAVVVFGAEGKGLHHQVREHCDVLVRIPMAGKISSLNVSVAAGVVLFDWKRRARSRQQAES